jgi:hypothetical protein
VKDDDVDDMEEYAIIVHMIFYITKITPEVTLVSDISY